MISSTTAISIIVNPACPGRLLPVIVGACRNIWLQNMARAYSQFLPPARKASPRLRRVSAKNGGKPLGDAGACKLKTTGKGASAIPEGVSGFWFPETRNHELETRNLILYTQSCCPWTGCQRTIWTLCSASCLHLFAMHWLKQATLKTSLR